MVRRRGHALQTRTFSRKGDAEDWARGIEQRLETGRGGDSKSTVGDLFRRYAEEVSPTKKGARWEQVRILRTLRTAKFIHRQVGKLAPQDIQAWRDLRAQEISGDSVNRELNLISAIFTHAIKEWHIPLMGNPVRMVKRLPKSKARNRRITQRELALLWKSREGPRTDSGTLKENIPWAFELCVQTAMRFGELMALRWEDVHLDEGWVHVVDSKNGEERFVPLTDRAAQMLLELRGGVADREGRVFAVNAGSLSTECRDWFATLGLADLHFHDSRHEAISRMAKKFSNVLELSAVTGHKDLKSLKVYYNPTPQELVAKLRKDGGKDDSPPPDGV